MKYERLRAAQSGKRAGFPRFPLTPNHRRKNPRRVIMSAPEPMAVPTFAWQTYMTGASSPSMSRAGPRAPLGSFWRFASGAYRYGPGARFAGTMSLRVRESSYGRFKRIDVNETASFNELIDIIYGTLCSTRYLLYFRRVRIRVANPRRSSDVYI